MTADATWPVLRHVGRFLDELQSTYELDLARQQLGKALQRIPKRADIQVSRGPRPIDDRAAGANGCQPAPRHEDRESAILLIVTKLVC